MSTQAFGGRVHRVVGAVIGTSSLGVGTVAIRQNEYTSPTIRKPARAHKVHMNQGVCCMGITGGDIAADRCGARTSLDWIVAITILLFAVQASRGNRHAGRRRAVDAGFAPCMLATIYAHSFT